MKKLKKVFCTLLSMAMLLSVCATAAFADIVDISTAEALEGAFSSGADQSIRLTDNITVNNRLIISNGQTVVLNLNGHTLSKDQLVIMVSHGTLKVIGPGRIVETTEDGFAPVLIKGSANAEDTGYSVVEIGEDVELQGWAGLFIDKNGTAAYGVEVEFNGDIVSPAEGHTVAGHGIYINGTIQHEENCPEIVIGKTASVTAKGGSTGIYAAGYARWTIKGGTFTSEEGSVIEIKGGVMDVQGGTFSTSATSTNHAAEGNGTSTSGYVIAAVDNVGYAGAVVNITGGSFEGQVALLDDSGTPSEPVANEEVTSELNITGGTYTEDPSMWVPEDCEVFERTNNGFVVVDKSSIGDEEETVKYTIEAEAGEGGSISPNGEYTTREGNSKNFVIKADSGYRIQDVLVDGESVGAVNEYMFADIDDDHTIEAIFEKGAGASSGAAVNNPSTGAML